MRLLAASIVNSDDLRRSGDEDKKCSPEIGTEDKSSMIYDQINQTPEVAAAASEVITITRLLASRSSAKVPESFEADFMKAIEAILARGEGAEVVKLSIFAKLKPISMKYAQRSRNSVYRDLAVKVNLLLASFCCSALRQKLLYPWIAHETHH